MTPKYQKTSSHGGHGSDRRWHLSPAEAQLLRSYRDAFGLEIEALSALEHTICEIPEITTEANKSEFISAEHPHPDLLHPLKDWLDGVEMHDPRLARFICKMVPPQCPFERDIVLFGHKLVHIPPLCKLNPLYEQLVGYASAPFHT